MKELISILVPAYNVEKYIGRCLDSLVNQTYENIEIIVINDGSTDNTSIILDEYSSKYKNIKVLQQSNHGIAYTRNRCLDNASGSLYYYMLNTAGITYGKFNEKRLDVFKILKERMLFYKSNNEYKLYEVTIGEILEMYERYYQNAIQRNAMVSVTTRIKQECKEVWTLYVKNKVGYIWMYPKVYQMLCPIATPLCMAIRVIKKWCKKKRVNNTWY